MGFADCVREEVVGILIVNHSKQCGSHDKNVSEHTKVRHELYIDIVLQTRLTLDTAYENEYRAQFCFEVTATILFYFAMKKSWRVRGSLITSGADFWILFVGFLRSQPSNGIF